MVVNTLSLRAAAAQQAQVERIVGGVDSATPASRTAATPVVFGGAPRSYQVVSVAVPAEIAAGQAVSFSIEPTGRAPILGPRRGTIDPASRSAVVVTVGIPGNMLAGQVTVAHVTFTSPGVAPIRVPLDLVIPVVPQVEVRVARERVGGAAGRTMSLRFAVKNAGNADDTLDVVASGPGDWDVRIVGTPQLVLHPGESEQRELRVSIPTSAGLGEGIVTLVTSSHMVERARGTAVVEIGGAYAHGPRTATVAGAMLTSRDDAGNQHATAAATLSGLLLPELDVSGRFTTPLPVDPAMRLAQSTFGYSNNSNFISLLAPHWGATAGTTNLLSSPLAGLNVMGQGGLFSLRADSSTLHVMAVRPFDEGVVDARRDVSVAARGELVRSSKALTASYAHLHDDLFSPRQLDALGIGGRFSPWERSAISAEIAERRHADGNGVGLTADFVGRVFDTRTDLRVLHAPGGSSAFAQARDLVTANLARSDFQRVSTAASAWWTADDNATFSALDSRGGAFSTSVSLPLNLEVGSDLRRLEFTSVDTMGRFTSRQSGYAARLGAHVGWLSWSGDWYQDEYAQRAVTRGGPELELPSTVSGVRGQMRLEVLRGSVGVNASSEQRVSTFGAEARQVGYGLHGERLRVIPRLAGVTLSGSLWHVSYGRQSLDSKRAALDMEINASTRVVLAAQQDALIRSASGRPRTIVSLKVERGATLPFANRRAAVGIVFEDLDGDGRRGRGERGIPGIIMRRDGETAITDARGGYRFREGAGGKVWLDQRSLPRGWLESAAPIAGEEPSLDFGIIPVVSLDIQVVVAPSGRTAPFVTLGPVTIGLRDARGRQWVAKTNGEGRVVFDALPPGRYELDLEAPESSEPLIFDRIRSVDVKSTGEWQHLEIVGRTRPIRVLDPRSKQQGGAKDRETGTSRESGAPPTASP
jgi:hypothetical protein